jgi:hypothetical protein
VIEDDAATTVQSILRPTNSNPGIEYVAMERCEAETGNPNASALTASGFPFQTAVAAVIRAAGADVEEEVAWQDADNSHKFIDIVASVKNARVCIECKAMRHEKLIFLLPTDVSDLQRGTVSAIATTRVQDSTRRPIVVYGTAHTYLRIHESRYCVVVQGKTSDNRLLEREIQPLVRAAEEYAKDRCEHIEIPRDSAESIACIPVFVTMATLFVVEYDPLGIPLNQGALRASKDSFRPVKQIRFTKQFTASGFETTRVRTVIVTQAQHIAETITTLAGVLGPLEFSSGKPMFEPIRGNVWQRKR